MNKNNKPEVVADPAKDVETLETPESKSDPESIRERIAETQEKQKTGDVLDNALNTKPEEAQPGGTPDVVPQETTSKPEEQAKSETTDPDVATLMFIEASTGRKFDNIESAKKYLTSLNNLVGDQAVAGAREAEKILTSLSQKLGKPTSELESFVVDLALAKTTEKPAEKPKPASEVKAPETRADDELSKRLEKLEHTDQIIDLKEKYPEAAEVVEDIALIAKSKGISYVEAYEMSPVKTILENKVEEEAKNPIVTPTNRINIDYKKAQALGQKALRGQATGEDMEDLVKTVLGL